MAAMARAREFLLNFPSTASQGFLALVGGGYVTYYFCKISVFAMDGFFFVEKEEKERRREQYIREAVELRAAANARRESEAGHGSSTHPAVQGRRPARKN